MLVHVYTTQNPKILDHFQQYTKKWLEIKLLTYDFVSSAA